ncbi:MAG: metallophosphoesterase [Candidatus Thorarchaeota archaeon]
MSENKPIILVTSDVHLGSLDCEIDLFIQFLKEINDKKFGKDLQALIILGDFIDLCMDVPKTILKREKIQEIFTLLLNIKKWINLIFVIGNHEIPVIGDYDEKFKRRKIKFLKKFQNSDFSELFDNELYCQYLLLKKWNNEDTLLLYDTRDQIERNPNKKIIIKGLGIDSDYCCFMTHGYQFDGDIYRFFVGQIWKSLINNSKFALKETYDYFWNKVIKEGRKIKPITFEQMKKELSVLKNKSINEIDSSFHGLSYVEFNIIKLNMRIMKRWERASNPNSYFNEIKEFLEEKDYDFPKITHVIYGHTHHSGISYGYINNLEVEILNDGAWQRLQPSYVEINTSGRLKLKAFPNDNNS